MNSDDIDHSILKNSILFHALDDHILSQLVREMSAIELSRDEILFLQEDQPNGCYSVLEGALKVSILNAKGEETILAVLGVGDIVGEIGLIDKAPRSATITALKPTRLAFLPTRHFNQFLERTPQVYPHLLQILSTRLRETNEALTRGQKQPIETRLAHTLLRLADGFGQPASINANSERVIIMHKFTQSELGLMVGCARENISRQLNIWCREGILSKNSGYYCLEKTKALLDLSKQSD